MSVQVKECHTKYVEECETLYKERCSTEYEQSALQVGVFRLRSSSSKTKKSYSECPSGEFTAYRVHYCSTLGAPNGSANVNQWYESEVELHRR